MHQFTKMMCNGEFMAQELDEAFDFFDHLAESPYSWDIAFPETSSKNKTSGASSGGGKCQLREDDDLRVRIATLTKKVEAMEFRKVNEVQAIPQERICSIGEVPDHSTKEYSTIPAFKEVLLDQANVMNNFSTPTHIAILKLTT